MAWTPAGHERYKNLGITRDGTLRRTSEQTPTKSMEGPIHWILPQNSKKTVRIYDRRHAQDLGKSKPTLYQNTNAHPRHNADEFIIGQDSEGKHIAERDDQNETGNQDNSGIDLTPLDTNNSDPEPQGQDSDQDHFEEKWENSARKRQPTKTIQTAQVHDAIERTKVRGLLSAKVRTPLVVAGQSEPGLMPHAFPITEAGRGKLGHSVEAISRTRNRRQKAQQKTREEPVFSSEKKDEPSPGTPSEEGC